MKELYRAWVIPLFEGHRQEDKKFWGYRQAYSINQAHMLLMRAYPYPQYYVEQPVKDLRETKVTEIDVKSKIRGELVRLKTDVGDSDEIGFKESHHRGLIEKTLQTMENCNLKDVFEDLLALSTAQHLLSKFDEQHRIPKIESLLIDTLVEIANNNCKCQFIKED
ncbi:hypothetical protein KKE60_04620 [Patescibacteria group bacterium]|nr:hypothetical protein [Patescibacteria group bacterium]